MPPRHTEFSRRAARWFVPAALLALAPKCLLCVLTYAGLGAALRLGGPEICGVSAGSPGSWASSLAWLGVAGGLGTFGFLASCRAAAIFVLPRAPLSGSNTTRQGSAGRLAATWSCFISALERARLKTASAPNRPMVASPSIFPTA